MYKMAQLFKKINKNVSVIRNLPEPKWELLTFGYFWWSFGGSHQAVSLKLSSWPVSGRSVDSV